MNPDLTEITVVGDDDTGLLAEITSLLFERDINIEDLDQAVKDGLFRMTMHVDISRMSCSKTDLREALTDRCGELGMDVTVRFPSESDTRSIAVLATKESHCLEALLDECTAAEFPGTIDVVIGNHPDLKPVARRNDIPFHDVGDENGSPDECELLDRLEEYGTDLVVLARYMRILSPEVVFRYRNRIINVHPSLLPAFPGASAYMQAIEEGVRIAGVTAHYVTTDLDQGPIITQRAFNVPDDATEEDLQALGQPLEADALVEAVRLHVTDNLITGRGRTHFRDESDANPGLPQEIDDLSPSHPVDESISGDCESKSTADD